ncbi:MAG: response regulator [Clostridia bacterium]|nr:response regulator [Clostridia bacterium]
MYKVMICDDEKWIRKGVAAKISRMELPVSEIFEAEDIAEAEALMELHQPEIVITDICMAEDNGLDFLEEIAHNYPNVRFIILSGYSEFTYAERAIRLGVVAYLLKPVDMEELKDALLKAFSKYEENKHSLKVSVMERMLKNERENYQTEVSMNRIFFGTDLQQSVSTAKSFKESRGYEGMLFGCILLQIEESSYEQSGFNKQETDLLKYGVKNVIAEVAEICELDTDILMDLKYAYRMIIIARGKDELTLEAKLNQFVTQMYNAVSSSLNLNISVSVSHIHDDLVRDLYFEAQKAMHVKFIGGANRIFWCSKHIPKSEFNMPAEKFEILQKHLKEGNSEGAKLVVHNIIAGCKVTEEYIFYVYMNIVNLALNSCDEAIYVINSSEYNYMNVDNLEQFENSEQIEEFINVMLERICNIQKNFTVSFDCREVMNKVKLYIEKNYMNKISVTDLAKFFNINYSYFSTIFKEQVGMTLTEYLRNVRIEKACSMLKNSDMNTEFIATSVGFNDTMYFYRIFKRCKGMTPTEYRNSFDK